jgi:O-antigen/teichoic acid export membrane protein
MSASPTLTEALEPARPGQAPLVETSEFRQQMGSISRHSSVFLAGTIFTAAAGYLFKIYLARVLGANALGIYTLGMTIVGFLGIFNALGLPKSAVRFVATYSSTGRPDMLRAFLGRSLALLLGCNLLLGISVLLIGPWVAVHFYHTPLLTNYMGLFAVLMILGVLNAFVGEVLVGYKAVAQRTVITSFISSPAVMIATLAFIAMGLGLGGYILAQVVAGTVVLILLATTAWKLTPRAARASSIGFPPLEKDVVSFSTAVFSLGLIGFALSTADKVLIGFYLNPRSVGMYAMASSVVTFVPILLQSVNQIFSPTIADLYTRQQNELLGRLFQTLTRWICGLTLPLAMVIMLFAPALMRMFGREFEAAWPILIIGTIGQLVNCGVGSAGTLLLMSGNQRSLLKTQTVMALVMVILSVLFIPRWGITGAAVAAAVTLTISNFWYLREVRDKMGLWPYNRSYLRLIAPVSGTAVVLLLIRSQLGTNRSEWMVIAGALLIGYTVFIGIALATGLDSDDRVVARAVWLRLRSMLPVAEVAS